MATHRIVIVGGGFGGAYCAAALEKQRRGRDVDVLLLNRTNYFVFYPLLIEAGTGHLEPRHAVVSLRAFVKRTRFHMAEVDSIDFDQRVVRYRVAGRERVDEAPYDDLVLALGSVTMLPPLPGLREHGLQMKSMADAVALRDRCIRLLELADATDDAAERKRLLHLTVVGGSYTGVEVAGEFHEFLHRAAKHYPNVPASDIGVTLVEMTDRILPTIDRELADYAAERLQRRGVELALGDKAARITDDRVELASGRVIESRTLIWAAGIAPPPLVKELGLPTDERGYIRCERDLSVTERNHVWAIGDAASNPDPDGNPYPATAQHALQQGEHLAANLMRALDGQPTQPCNVNNRGTLASLGCRTAVASVKGVKLSGFFAWWLYRTVYLMKMPGWMRRFRLALDWTVGLFFKTDYVQLGLHKPTRPPDE